MINDTKKSHRCSACGELGHNKKNKLCIKYVLLNEMPRKKGLRPLSKRKYNEIKEYDIYNENNVLIKKPKLNEVFNLI